MILNLQLFFFLNLHIFDETEVAGSSFFATKTEFGFHSAFLIKPDCVQAGCIFCLMKHSLMSFCIFDAAKSAAFFSFTGTLFLPVTLLSLFVVCRCVMYLSRHLCGCGLHLSPAGRKRFALTLNMNNTRADDLPTTLDVINSLQSIVYVFLILLT